MFAPDWIVNKGTINFDGTGVWFGVLGDYCSVDLDGNTAGGIVTKNFRTKPGASYTLSFVLSGVGGTRPTVKKIQISIDDREFNVYRWDCAGGNDAQHGDYATETWAFQATKSLSFLTFRSLDQHEDSGGAVIEQIAITITKN